jgi:hypothetical protein
VDVEEGGSVTLGIMPVKRETVILRNLPPQGFAESGEVGVLTHTFRYDSWRDPAASWLPRLS